MVARSLPHQPSLSPSVQLRPNHHFVVNCGHLFSFPVVVPSTTSTCRPIRRHDVPISCLSGFQLIKLAVQLWICQSVGDRGNWGNAKKKLNSKELFLSFQFIFAVFLCIIVLSLKTIGKCITRRLQSRLSPVVSFSVLVTAAQCCCCCCIPPHTSELLSCELNACSAVKSVCG